MAKKQFNNVVSNITKPYREKERVTSMSELLEDERASLANPSINPVQIENVAIQNEMVEQREGRGVPNFVTNTVDAYQTRPEAIQQQINVKQEKPRANNKVIRDGYSMPEHDYQLLEMLKRKALMLAHDINKSEILRAGLQCLNRLSNEEFSRAIQGVSRIKPGRKVE